MRRTFKHIILLLLLLAVQFLKAQPTTRIQLPQLQEAPSTSITWVVVSSGDTAIWAQADTLTTAAGAPKYYSLENTDINAFDTLDFTVRQDILSTPMYLTAETVGTNQRIRIGHDFGLIDANEAVNDDDFLPYYTGTINRRMTVDTLLGFDTLQLSGNTLRISQRLDGDATYEVDLSSLGGGGTSDTLTLAADSGTAAELTNGSTFTISGGYGLSSAISGTTVTMDADSAVWATVSSVQDTAAAVRGDIIQPYVSFNGAGHVPFDTLDFFASGAVSVTSSTSGTNERVSIAHAIGNMVINEAIASTNYLPWWTGAIDRRATVDTLLGFDVFQLNGTDLEISQRLDGDATYSVDLSSLQYSPQYLRVAETSTTAVYAITTTRTTIDTVQSSSTADFATGSSAGQYEYVGTGTPEYLVNFQLTAETSDAGREVVVEVIADLGAGFTVVATATEYFEAASEIETISGTMTSPVANGREYYLAVRTSIGTTNLTVKRARFNMVKISN